MTFSNTALHSNRRILHIDFDYFFAQCEEIRNPKLKDKPVVVCVFSGRTEESGVVSTANYIARKYGVKSGIPIKLAKSRLAVVPDAVFLPLDIDYYSRLSGAAMSIIESNSDQFERVGIDECYLDISKKSVNFDEAKTLAMIIKRDVKDQTQLTCSVGVAPNKILAKIASDINKPDGLTVITPAKVTELLDSMDVDKMPGIGPKTKQRLGGLGIKTIGDLAKMDLFKLIEEFGKKNATYMHYASLGINDEPVLESVEQKQQVSRIVTLKSDATRSEEMYSELYQLCQSVFQIASAKKLSFKTVGILLILDNLKNITRSKTLKVHTNDFAVLHLAAKTILDEAMAEVGNIKVRRLGVKVSDFQSDAGQNTLLDFMDSKS